MESSRFIEAGKLRGASQVPGRLAVASLLIALCFLSCSPHSSSQGVEPVPIVIVPHADSPLPPGVTVVEVTGKATIINGDQDRAREKALLDAYRNAIHQGAGVHVRDMFEMRNFQFLVNAITRESAGYITSYEVLSSGVSRNDPRLYSVIIRAHVKKGDMVKDNSAESLKLFLKMLGNPRLLIVLEEIGASTVTQFDTAAGGKSADLSISVKDGGKNIEIKKSAKDESQTEKARTTDLLPGMPEAILSDILEDAGYEVSLGDDLLADGASKDTVASARKGNKSSVRELGVVADADIALYGSIRYSVYPTVYGGKDLWGATAHATIRAMTPSTGERFSLSTSSSRGFSHDALGSKESAIRNACKHVAEELRWELLNTLANKGRSLSVDVTNCALNDYDVIKKLLEQAPGVGSVSPGAWKKEKGGSASFKVYTSPAGATAFDLRAFLTESKKVRFDTKNVSRLVLSIELLKQINTKL